ncbi:20339_t:CDS:2 [Cetraspora pellucida]|uniref:20339_t:CDS:1 n=1 Tax=Cetraspora pellucida TaxID=1433469 RepID=A0A9N9BF94_9GLOM|nr:20339_t:CDS:2 [Cetraspora pellucida]
MSSPQYRTRKSSSPPSPASEPSRKKSDLRKNSNPRRPTRQTQRPDGTVNSLKPYQPLTVRESTLVVEASQLMAAKRADCVLVVDSEERLSGIFTAKDLAFRVVGDGLDSRTTSVAAIMTRNPMCVRSNASATDALNTMVHRGFRHLPVCNEEGDVVGLLDITKCLYEALDKMERAYGSSKKLYDALEGVEREWSNQPTPIHQYMNMLRETMACPDLSTILDGSMPAEVSTRTSVRDAARLMREYHTTAVLVMEHNLIAGIFTSKDIVLRVIAAGLDPSTCSVAKVMTPHPDTAPPHTSILEALKKMYDGHYLNLPVVDGGSILGMVDMYSKQPHENGHENGGPMWNKFWNSLDDDNESVASDSIAPSQSASNIPPPSPNSRMRNSGHVSPIPEIHPGESASAVDDGSLASFPRGHDENHFTFKFKAPNGKSHRFTVDYTSFEHIRSTVASKLPPSFKDFSISYVDDDEDLVAMSNDEDVEDAVHIAQRQGQTRGGRKPIRRGKKSDDNIPFSHELLLPGALITLAIAIIGVFAISRLTK